MHCCIHKDQETGWCKLLSDWSEAMPIIQYCIEGPCPYDKMPPHWIEVDAGGDEGWAYQCSECENIFYGEFTTIEDWQKMGRHLYCDHCGEKMYEG